MTFIGKFMACYCRGVRTRRYPTRCNTCWTKSWREMRKDITFPFGGPVWDSKWSWNMWVVVDHHQRQCRPILHLYHRRRHHHRYCRIISTRPILVYHWYCSPRRKMIRKVITMINIKLSVVVAVTVEMVCHFPSSISTSKKVHYMLHPISTKAWRRMPLPWTIIIRGLNRSIFNKIPTWRNTLK